MDLKDQSAGLLVQQRINFDAALIVSLVICLGALFSYAFLLSPWWQETFDFYIAELLFLALTTLLFLRNNRKIKSRNIRLFRNLIAAGLGIWLLASILGVAFDDLAPAQSALFKDLLFLGYFACLIVAIELRLELNSTGPALQQYTAAAIGSVLLLVTIFLYFGILPLFVIDRTYSTPYALHACLDGYIALRFMLAAHQSTSKGWYLMFFGFAVVFSLMVIADLLAWAYRNGNLDYIAGAPTNLLWYTWFPLAMILSGLQIKDASDTTRYIEQTKLSIATRGLLVFGLTIPFIHVTGYAIGFFDIDSRHVRDMLVGVWIVIIATLFLGAYFYFRQRVSELDVQRIDAETRAEQFENQLNRELRIRSLGRLSAGLSHDFSNTLTAISLYEDLIRKKIDSGQSASEDLDGLAKSIRYAKDIVDKMRIFGNSGEQVSSQTLNFSAEVLNTVELIGTALPHGIELSFEEQTTDLHIAAESPMVHQVVINFIYNAADALRSHGKIRVLIAQKKADIPCVSCGETFTGNYAVLEVLDSGPGIAAELASQIFEPLVSTKPAGKGSGLGLSTVHIIMHNLGGHVGLTTEIGRGSRFGAYFPIVDAITPDQTATSNHTANAALSSSQTDSYPDSRSRASR